MYVPNVNVDVLDSVGNIPYNEYRQLRDYIVLRNNKGDALSPTDCKEIGNNLYIWRNISKTDFIVVDSIPITDNYDAKVIRSDLENGNIRSSKSVGEWSANIRGGRRSGTILGGRVERTEPNRSDDRLSVGQSGSNTLGHFVEGSGVEKKINYALSSHDSDVEFWDEWLNLVKEYGAIPSGENPHRKVQVPLKTADGKKVSQTVRTILEAKATPDEAVPTIEKMVEDGIFSYDAYTDKQAIKDAEDYLKEYGWEKSYKNWFNDVEKGIVSKQHTAMGWALYNNAANTAETSTSESEIKTAVRTSLEILDAMAKHQRSAAQALQATRILKKLSPETQLYGVQKSVGTTGTYTFCHNLSKNRGFSSSIFVLY